MNVIWWIRRDLRLTDNPALQAALEAGSVLPAFILDPAFSRSSPRRKDFLSEGLHALDQDLRARGSYLVIRSGRPQPVLKKLLEETKAGGIFAEEDFTPYARQRDNEIVDTLPLSLVHGQTVHHPYSVLKHDGKPYTVFTPYSKAWKAKVPSGLNILPAPERLDTPDGIYSEPLPGFRVSPLFPSAFKPYPTMIVCC